MKSAIIYDCEIIKAIPNKYGERVEGIEYCNGWRDFSNMGVSVIGVYDYIDDQYCVFCADNSDDFTALWDNREICVGFNNIAFDNALIRADKSANWQAPDDSKSYDLLREIWAANNLGSEFNPDTHGGYGLDAMCKVNFGTKKTGNGALAPVLWQQGKIGEVINYCLNDIRLTKQLFDAVLSGRPIISPKDGAPSITLRIPK